MFGDGPQRAHFGLRPPAAADLLASKVRWHPAKISRTLWPLGLIWRSLLSRSRKGQRRFGGFDQKIIAMYAQRMTVREIQRFLEEQYIVHSIRNSLSFCNWKQRQPVARELKQIDEAETAELAAKPWRILPRVLMGKSCPPSPRVGDGAGSK